jgi:hypothetical protein
MEWDAVEGVEIGFELIGAETPIKGGCDCRIPWPRKKECFTKDLFGEGTELRRR